jgi:hypothetical protein
MLNDAEEHGTTLVTFYSCMWSANCPDVREWEKNHVIEVKMGKENIFGCKANNKKMRQNIGLLEACARPYSRKTKKIK